MPAKSFLSELTRPVLALAPAGPLDALGLLARIEGDLAALRRLVGQGTGDRRQETGGRGQGTSDRPATSEATSDVERILCAVEVEFSVTRAELVGRCRVARLVWPRQLAMWLVRHLTGRGLIETGKLLGHPVAAFYACKKVEAVLATDLDERDRMLALLDRLMPTLKNSRRVALPATGGNNGAVVEPSPPKTKAAHHCACGRPAALRKNSSWVCARCDAIESRHDHVEKR